MDKVIKSNTTGKGLVRMYDNGMMHQTYETGAEIAYQDTLNEFKIYKVGFCDRKRPILVELDNVKTVSKGSRGVYSSKETAEYFSAAALLVGTPVSRIIGNFYLGISKTSMPVQMFTEKEEAIAWLKTFITD